MGIFTPVKKVVMFTKASAESPIIIVIKALKRGFLFFPIFSKIYKITKIPSNNKNGK